MASPAQQMRDDVQELKFNFKSVIEPSLKTIGSDIKEIKQKDFLTEVKADATYIKKSDFDALQKRVDFHSKWGVIIATALISGLGGLFFLGIQKGLGK